MAVTGISTSALTGIYDDKAFPPAQAIPNALILSQTTVSKPIEGDAATLRVPYISTDSAAAIVAEGEEIEKGGAQFSVLNIKTRKVAVIETITNEVYSESEVRRMLTDSMAQAITDKADAVFLQNTATDAATNGAPIGIFNTVGAVDGGTITDALDPIVTALGKVAANGGSPTAIILNHATWSQLLLLKFSDGRPMIEPSVADSPTPMLYGIPIVINKMAPNNALAIIDRTDIISAVGAVSLSGSDQRYFESDAYAIRGTFRSGWGVIHSDRLAIVHTTEGKAK
ncbi:MAG: phage major capsid protein [Bifidobacterium sp.]|nr:phage major capsid protein [Bifidobacterium sp.]